MYKTYSHGNPICEGRFQILVCNDERSRILHMNKRKGQSGLQKEKMGMIAASVFVLSALTLTGVYFSAQEDSTQEENLIDFAQLEEQQNKELTQDGLVADTRFTKDGEEQLSNINDMDVDPQYTEVNSGTVKNEETKLSEEAVIQMERPRFSADELTQEEPALTTQEEEQEKTLIQASPSFGAEENLQWPIVGEVLLNYSMDKAIYFTTMEQYRYNPSIVIAAQAGEMITAAADGIVKDVYYDAQTGNTIVFDLGDGYELTYGQLEEITLNAGDIVAAGDVVGKVAEPTIYYTEEGCNVYFKMTKDGVPVNPLDRMGNN